MLEITLRFENIEGDGDAIQVVTHMSEAEYTLLDNWLTACAQSYDGLNSVILDRVWNS